MNTPAQCGVIKPPKTDIYSEAPHPYTPTTTTTTTTTCTRTITIPAETGPPTCPIGYNPVLTVGRFEISVTSCTLNRDTTSNRLDP